MGMWWRIRGVVLVLVFVGIGSLGWSGEDIVGDVEDYYRGLVGEDGDVGFDFVEELRKSAEGGDAESQFGLGMLYCLGSGVEKDTNEAEKWITLAAEAGVVNAQNTLFMAYYADEDDEIAPLKLGIDYDKAYKWAMMGAEQGDMQSQTFLGMLYENGHGVEQDDAEAFRWFMKAAEQGDSVAQYKIGTMYDEGIGVERDVDEAMKWYLRAAESGEPDAQYWIGVLYYLGQNVEHNINKSLFWLEKSAENGHARAQMFIGTIYYSGKYIDEDIDKAYYWNKKAVDQGLVDGMIGLVGIHLFSEGYIDYKMAMHYSSKLIENGHSCGLVYMGAIYEMGLGVEVDYLKAKSYYELAYEQGDPKAKNLLIRVEGKIEDTTVIEQ